MGEREIILMNLRLLAANVIEEVRQGDSLSDALARLLPTLQNAGDKAWVQAACFGVCRIYPRLALLLTQLLNKPLKKKDQFIGSLLLVGLYQILEMRIPPYAAVKETVDALQGRDVWARGLVNAILRGFLRKSETLLGEVNATLEGQYAHPAWWIEKIRTAWPVDWETILIANNSHPPCTLRVNQRMLTRDEYIQLLEEQNLNAQSLSETHEGLVLAQPLPAHDLPGFSAGQVSFQDGGAQLAADYLELAPELRVLDACAAPGGKYTHILERQDRLAICVGVEKEKARMPYIIENVMRLQLMDTAHQEIIGDALEPANWWDGQVFERILLDAPCSASGVIRRHPDIKLLRRVEDISQLAETQYGLLKALWPLLAVDGILLYCTCSIFPEENHLVLQKFLATTPDAVEYKIESTYGKPLSIGRQILPGMHDMDGFYYARLRKSIR